MKHQFYFQASENALTLNEIQVLVKIAVALKNTEEASGWAINYYPESIDCKCLICDEIFDPNDIHNHGRRHIEEYKNLMAFL